MRLAPEAKDANNAALKADTLRSAEGDPPPTYYDPADGTVASGSSLPPHLSPDVKLSNFVLLQRKGCGVKGTWVIDPALSIPDAFLPPLKGAARKNLAVEAEDGSIDVDVYVMPPSFDAGGAGGSSQRTRVTICTSSRRGSVTTRVHDVPPHSSLDQTRLPLFIESYTKECAINVHLPRSFCGPLRLKGYNGRVKFSDSVRLQLRIFSETDGVQRSFVGRFDASEFEAGKKWSGDELVAETKYGTINVCFDDEASIAAAKKKELGFFGRLFRSG